MWDEQEESNRCINSGRSRSRSSGSRSGGGGSDGAGCGDGGDGWRYPKVQRSVAWMAKDQPSEHT